MKSRTFFFILDLFSTFGVSSGNNGPDKNTLNLLNYDRNALCGGYNLSNRNSFGLVVLDSFFVSASGDVNFRDRNNLSLIDQDSFFVSDIIDANNSSSRNNLGLVKPNRNNNY